MLGCPDPVLQIENALSLQKLYVFWMVGFLRGCTGFGAIVLVFASAGFRYSGMTGKKRGGFLKKLNPKGKELAKGMGKLLAAGA